MKIRLEIIRMIFEMHPALFEEWEQLPPYQFQSQQTPPPKRPPATSKKRRTAKGFNVKEKEEDEEDEEGDGRGTARGFRAKNQNPTQIPQLKRR